MTIKGRVLEARGKINLALDVLGKRGDGFHQVKMIMQSIGLADQVGLREQASGITITTNLAGLECGPANLAYRAAESIMNFCGIIRGIHITLEKHIPMAAGLAGGSADAAAVLTGLNGLWALGVADQKLQELAATLGSDVPFCLQGGTMLATGRGEKLTPLPAMPHAWVVLAKLPVGVSTAWVYSQCRPDEIVDHPDIPGMIHCLAEQDLRGITARLGNVLERVTIPAYPEIAKIKEYMVEQGAMASLMTGSGPTVFALVDHRQQAEAIGRVLQEKTMAQVIITETVCSREADNGTSISAN